MKSISEMSQAELAAFVQTHLEKAGIEVVLSGGASVAFHSKDEYVSLDIDLIEHYFANPKKLPDLMKNLGFESKGRYFVHPESKYWIEFPPGPLSVGREPVKEIQRIELETGTLKIISPADCLKDRLLAYFHWNDHQSLSQAALVAKMNEIDWEEIQRWAINENSLDKYQAVRDFLQNQ